MKKLSFGFIIAILLLLVQAQTSMSKVIINEVLANEPSSETKLEWVELFNLDSSAVDLGGWTFISKQDTTVFPSGTLIPGKDYLILARKLVSIFPDTESFEYHWGNGSGVWGDCPEEDFPAIEVKLSLTNTAGTITLIDPEQNSSSFSWNKDTGDGISWERILPSGEDSLSNWGFCVYSGGNTPGKVNSLTPVPNDLSISSEDISIEPQSPVENQAFEVKVKVKNSGNSTSEENLLYFFCDYDFDGKLEENETLSSPIYIPPLIINQETTFVKELSLSRGNYRLYAQIGKDDKDYNNQAFINLRIGSNFPDIVINEFICSPNDNQPEWVELYNRTNSSINLKNFLFGDFSGQSLITNEDLNLNPHDYLVLTENYSLFLSSYPEANCNIIEPETWHILNNTGDRIILKDSLGFVMDEVSYNSGADIKGVSQERISPERKSSDPDNWWRSVDPKGSTPCKINSIQDSPSSDEVKVEINPDPFSPDGDGFEDQTRIKYTIPFRSELTLKIYDVKGRLVKTLMGKESRISGEIFWEGDDDQGRKVKVGIYILYLEVSGPKNLSKKSTVVVARR
ncbi:MAG: lamin tail domain-containing protein [candidate division Zixibacteria bacterium]|nr:lamin tail domain-containing protein [candidate division Zixibacteria bacterium]